MDRTHPGTLMRWGLSGATGFLSPSDRNVCVKFTCPSELTRGFLPLHLGRVVLAPVWASPGSSPAPMCVGVQLTCMGIPGLGATTQVQPQGLLGKSAWTLFRAE